MLLVCTMCDVNCNRLKEWNDHLISNIHQENASMTLKWDSTSIVMKERTIVCSQFNRSVNHQLLIEHFGSLSFIHDFCIFHSPVDGTIKACAVLLDSRKAADCFLDPLKLHNLQTSKLGRVARMSDLSEFQWEKAILSCKGELCQARHNQMRNNGENLPLQQQLIKFVKELKLTDEQIHIREQFMADLQVIIKKEFPSCNLVPFGSFASGLGGPETDIDVYVDIMGNSDISTVELQNSREDELNIIKRVTKILRRENGKRYQGFYYQKFKLIHPIYSARVPIIKLIERKFNLHADLSFKSHLSTFNTRLIKFCIEYDPRVEPLMLLVRYWAKYYNLAGMDKIKNYALMLLVIVFLNQSCIVPNVYYLQNFPGVKPIKIENFNVAFASNTDTVKNAIGSSMIDFARSYAAPTHEEEILNLTKGFFHMYANLDFETYVVCPFFGTCDMEKILYKKANRLPPEILWEDVQSFQYEKVMVVQDPFKLDVNVTANVRIDVLQKFQHVCHLTARALDDYLRNLQTGSKNSFLDIFVDINPPKGKISTEKQALDNLFAIPDYTTKSPVITTNNNNNNTVAVLNNKVEIPKERHHQNFTQIQGTSVRYVTKSDANGLHNMASSRITISRQFEDTFLEYFMEINEELILKKKKLKIVWGSFVTDFIMHIWKKAFGLSVEEIVKEKTFCVPPSFLIPINRLVRNASGPNSVLDFTSDDDGYDEVDRIASSQQIYPTNLQKRRLTSPEESLQEIKQLKRESASSQTDESIIIDDPNEITIIGEKVGSNNAPFPNNIANPHPVKSLKYSKLVTGLRKPFYEESIIYGDAKQFVGRNTPEFKNTQMLMRSSAGSSLVNPLNRAEKVTIMLSQIHAKECDKLVRFNCAVALDPETPELLLHFDEKIPQGSSYVPVIEFIALEIETLFYEHAMFRLQKLLQ